MLKLDRYDLKILEVLSRDGRITKSNLAEIVNLSISPVWQRVKRLETAGLIKGYKAEVDWDRVFQTSQVLVEITLGRHTGVAMQKFEDRMYAAPEVAFCYATGGGVDYIVMVRAQNIDRYQAFMERLLAEDLEIERYFTYIVTKTVKLVGDGPESDDRS